MNENERDLRRALVSEMQTALDVALSELDELEKRVAARLNADGPGTEQSNRLADQVALGMTKAGIILYKP